MFFVDLLNPSPIGIFLSPEWIQVPKTALRGERSISACMDKVGYMTTTTTSTALIAEKEEDDDC